MTIFIPWIYDILYEGLSAGYVNNLDEIKWKIKTSQKQIRDLINILKRKNLWEKQFYY